VVRSDDLAGRAYPPTRPYRVTREAVEAFAAALGDADPAYPALAPPTFNAVLAARAWQGLFDDPEVGCSLSRTIHTDQAFTFIRPIRPGDELEARLAVERARERASSLWLTLRVDIATTAGEPVCLARATLVHSAGTAAARAGSRDAAATAPAAASSPGTGRGAGPAPGWRPEPGAVLPGLTLAVTQPQVRQYALASGDDNPIHVSDAAARALGLPGAVAHGLLTMGLALRVVTQAGVDVADVRTWRARFVRPLPVPPDGVALHLAGRVTDVSGGEATVAVDAGYDAAGEVRIGVLAGAVATVAVHAGRADR